MYCFFLLKVIYRLCVVACLSIGLSQIAFAMGDPKSMNTDYDQSHAINKVQKARERALKLANGGDAGLVEAIAVDQEQLEFLKRRGIEELAYGNDSLVDRELDLHRDLAGFYARLHNKERALDELERMEMRADVPLIARYVRSAPEFAFLRSEPRFLAFLARLESPTVVWHGTAFATGYKANLTVEERVAGLSDFWARVRSGFVHFDNVPNLDWNQKYLEFLGRVVKSESTIEYYDTLMQFAPLLRDGHTNIYPPKELFSHFYTSPPIRTDLIEGKVIVTAVLDKSLKAKIRKGDEILAIDGKEVHQYANERVLPYVSSSTPQDADVRLYSYQLLHGDAKQPVSLTIRTPGGSSSELLLPRDGYLPSDGLRLATFETKRLAHNIIYLSLDEFEDDEGVKEFEKILPDIMRSDGLILDLRQNGGGNTKFGYDILSYLTDQPMPLEYSTYRIDDGYMQHIAGDEGFFYKRPVNLEKAEHYSRKEHFSGKVAVLIGPKTFSAAEDFLVSFDTLKRGIMVGAASGGSTGQPIFISLPGGGTARICVKDDRYPDGRKFVGVGIKPQVEVSETVADYRVGKDAVIETAVERLSQD